MKRHTLNPIIMLLSVLVFAATSHICEAGYVVENELNDSYSMAMNLNPYFTYGTNSIIEMDGAGFVFSDSRGEGVELKLLIYPVLLEMEGDYEEYGRLLKNLDIIPFHIELNEISMETEEPGKSPLKIRTAFKVLVYEEGSTNGTKTRS